MSSITEIGPGQIPDNFNVIIEIPANSDPIKYELDKESGLLCVDRFMPTAMFYPCNYGFVPGTLADDGDPADVLLITPFPVQAGTLVRCRAIGVLNMTDESGEDSKILALPTAKVCAYYANLHAIEDIQPMLLESIRHFFENYKGLEPGKWVKVRDWQGKEAAVAELVASVKRYQDSL